MTSWIFEFHKDAENFFKKRIIDREEIIKIILKALQKFRGEEVNIDISKLRGDWQGFYRIKIGKIRIIVYFDFQNFKIFVRAIEFRGRIYKK